MTVHNLRTEKMQPGDVYVGRVPRTRLQRQILADDAIEGRDGYFGNPFFIGEDGNRDDVLLQFEARTIARIAEDPEYRSRVAALHGKRLFCYCAPRPCHADVLERLAAALSSNA